VNLHVVKLFKTWKRVSYFITVGVIVRRDDRRGTEVKENDGGGWSSDVVVFWQGMSKNGDTIEWCEEWPMLRWPFYSSGGWESDGLRKVDGNGGVDDLLKYHWFSFGLREEATERSFIERWSRSSEFALTLWEGSVPRRDDVGRSRGGTGEEKWRRRCQLGWWESYWA
jgi:hypothetical protein